MNANSVGKIIELLSNYPKDSILTNESNQPFIHIVNRSDGKITLSTLKPIGSCNNCGDYVYPSDVKDYKGVCTTCDINVYSFELTPLNK